MGLRASNVAYVELEIEGEADLGVVRFSGTEAISQLYRFTVDLWTPKPLSQVFRKRATLRIGGGDDEHVRVVHGMVHTLSNLGNNRGGRLQRVEIMPEFALLRHRQDCRIFQNLTVEQICREVVARSGLAADGLRFRLLGDHAPREYCVQYRETDWDFLCRVLAEAGCHFYFEHTSTGHTMVASDDAKARVSLPGGEDLRVADRSSGQIADADHVMELWYEESIGPGKFSARDYNYLTPSDTLDSRLGGGAQDLEVFDYPGRYADAGAGRTVAQARLEALQAPLRRARGRGGCARLTPGYAFVGGHDLSQDAIFEGALRVLEVTHRGEQPQTLGVDGAGVPSSYSNEFVCMPVDVAMRVPCPGKPMIAGTQTAVVAGPEGEEVYTDELGRIKVQFHWDRQGKYDDQSSCWVRVSQMWAAPGWGSVWLPRIGHEVVVTFLDGDPDRPLVIGSVYHAVHGAPFALPDQRTRSGMRSDSSPGGGGYNEFAFEDRKGAEEVSLRAQKDLRTLVLNDAEHEVGHDETRGVKNDRSTTIGHDETNTIGNSRSEMIGVDLTQSIGSNSTQQVGANATQTVGANQSVTVTLCKTETVGVASAETVGAAKQLSVGAIYSVSVGASMNEVVGGSKKVGIGGDHTEVVGKNSKTRAGAVVEIVAGSDFSASAGKEMTLTAGTNLKVSAGKKARIEAVDELVIQVGQAIVTVKKNGQVYVAGTKLTLKASGDVLVKGGKIKLN